MNEESKHIHKLISSATKSWKKKDSKKLSALGHCLVPTLQLHFFQLTACILYYDVQYSGSYLQYLIVAGFDQFTLKLYIKTRKKWLNLHQDRTHIFGQYQVRPSQEQIVSITK